MKNADLRVDAYIKKSEPFATIILNHLRKQVHKTCPGVTETIKWGFPHFEYEGMLCFMAGFKSHCSFGFCRANELRPDEWDGQLFLKYRLLSQAFVVELS